MRVAILSESDADEAAIRILLEALLGETVEPVARRIRSRGMRAVMDQIAPQLKSLHYQQAAEAMVVVVDTDNSPLHSPQHEAAPAAETECRLCRLRIAAQQARRGLRPASGRPEVRVALGVAPPAIEAWLLMGMDSQISEAGWLLKRQRQVDSRDEIVKLKQRLCPGKTRSAQAMMEAAVAAAQRVAANIGQLEDLFPNSFGPLARDVRGWKTAT